MSIADLETIKDTYSATGANTIGSEFFVELIAILTALEASTDTLDTKLDALEARVEALEG